MVQAPPKPVRERTWPAFHLETQNTRQASVCYSSATLNRWLHLAGKETQVIDLAGMKVEFSAWPATLWRFIPLFGQWRIFRLGHHLAFCVSAKILEVSEEASEITESVRLRVFIRDNPTDLNAWDTLVFELSGRLGDSWQITFSRILHASSENTARYTVFRAAAGPGHAPEALAS